MNTLQSGTAEQMVERLVRIYGTRTYTPGAVVIELHDANGDLLDKAAVVPAAWRAYWRAI